MKKLVRQGSVSVDMKEAVGKLREIAIKRYSDIVMDAVLAERGRCAKIAEGARHPESGGGWRDDREIEGFDLACEMIVAKIRSGE